MVAYSFKARFIAPIRAGLGIKHLNERGMVVIPGATPKRQTIRARGKRRHARPGEQLQLYHAMRTKACFLIGRSFCKSTEEILIKIAHADADLSFRIAGQNLTDDQAEDFARADGFGSIEDMWLFWRTEHSGVERFEGVVIGWNAT